MVSWIDSITGGPARYAETERELRDRITELEQKLEHERRLVQVTAMGNMFDRFHAFDGIKDDRCPACGSHVRVIEDHNSVRLEAIR